MMYELPGVMRLTRKSDYMYRFDMHDGFYALGINLADRDYLTVNVRGQLYRLAGLPMGWSLSPFYFYKMTLTFVNFQRSSSPVLPRQEPGHKTKTHFRRQRWRGAHLLPYVDDFLFFATTQAEALTI
jgi:hypothetical protein